jgi:hypothetical protein
MAFELYRHWPVLTTWRTVRCRVWQHRTFATGPLVIKGSVTDYAFVVEWPAAGQPGRGGLAREAATELLYNQGVVTGTSILRVQAKTALIVLCRAYL